MLKAFCKFFVVLALVSVISLVLVLKILRVDRAAETGADLPRTLHITSQDFKEGELIDRRFTCQGEDISPQLAWHGAPLDTKSFVIIVTDYHAPSEHFPVFNMVHWLLYDLPPARVSLPTGLSRAPALDGGGWQGFHEVEGIVPVAPGYIGPCPPMGTHDYVVRLYALDKTLRVKPDQINKQLLLEAMQGHILATGETYWRYRRQP